MSIASGIMLRNPNSTWICFAFGRGASATADGNARFSSHPLMFSVSANWLRLRLRSLL